MARGRPVKEKIAFTGWTVDMFDNDTRFDKLLDSPHGWARFGVYFYLSQKAGGSEGYYYPWSFDDAASTARKMGGGMTSDIIIGTVNLCFEIGLFDKGLFEKYGILSGTDAQERFLVVAKERKRVSVVVKEYWLLGGAENAKISFVPAEMIFDPPKADDIPAKLNYDPPKGELLPAELNYEGKSNVENEFCAAEGYGRVEKGKEGVGKGSGSEGEPDFVSLRVDDAPAVGYGKPTGVTTTLTITLQKGIYYFTQKQIEEYGVLYPDVDIVRDIEKMQKWLNEHPECRLSKKGVSKFVSKWMTETQNDEVRKKSSIAVNNHADNGRKSSFNAEDFFKKSVERAMSSDD